MRNKILLLGAMSVRKPLPQIGKELRAIRSHFKNNAISDFEYVYESSLDIHALQEILVESNDETLIVHFAGHSSTNALETDDGVVNAHHLAKYLATWDLLPDLLFLNGCNSAGQVKAFLNAGVGCVIATQNFVDDHIAGQFAQNVYKHLLDDDGTVVIETAFERAQHATLLPGEKKPRSLDIEDLDEPPSVWDWGLFAQSDDILKTWTLSHPVVGNQVCPSSDWLREHAVVGDDEYGYYADININEVIQRLRWIVSGDENAAGFWLADTECTQSFWEAVMGNNPAELKLSPEHPVERVSWSKVQQFLQKLNAKLSGVQARLPTEQEWELACRAGTTSAYAFGDDVTQAQVNFAGQSTLAVKALPPNAWGLYAMHGNVWEWCEDGDDSKVICGGSWALGAESVRSDMKGLSAAGNRDYTIGFRFVVNA